MSWVNIREFLKDTMMINNHETSHGRGNSHFFSFYCDYSNWLTLSNASELFWSWISINNIQVHEENEFCHCLFTSFTKHDWLGFFTGGRVVEGKEFNVQKSVMHVQSVFLPCQAIAYLTFSSLPHLKLPIIYDILWWVKNRMFSGQIELLLLIASKTFFRRHNGSSFVSG